MTTRVPMTNSEKVALVDDDDRSAVLERNWRLSARGYPVTNIPHPDGRRNAAGKIQHVNLGLHRLVMNLGPGDPERVDIRDGNPLNCQKANLRIADYSTIGMKQRPQTGRTSPYRGVSWCTSTQRWRAMTKVRGVKHFLGEYVDENKAHAAVQAFLARQRGGSA